MYVFSRNLKLPSRHPSVVCESCLYSLNKDMRARAFHIMDPSGVLDTLLIFLEQRDEAAPCILSCGFSDDQDKISLLLGQWNSLSITKRSGIYGATIEKAETVTKLEVTRGGQLIHEFSSLSYGSGATTNVNWRGKISRNIINYDGGFHVTILLGGMYMGFPCDIFKSVVESQ
ncbi:hypothetical protein AXF42_Ash004844 [Apostasia shenzhenica]|uniref:Uncharacterized protein n=1 Tax=Apostasia shenzhenica TaxID=1088818 RepID=A0A2I0B7Q7_9ASPA|nr:hypothetical protein AXF42_Ash004844 [Apostasia shenzhenica]